MFIIVRFNRWKLSPVFLKSWLRDKATIEETNFVNGHVTLDRWHMTHDTWHVTGVEHCVKCQVLSSNGFGFMVFLRFGGNGSLTWSFNDKGVCRTAPATPGQLISYFYWWGDSSGKQATFTDTETTAPKFLNLNGWHFDGDFSSSGSS